MFVVTADQRGSRRGIDLVPAMVELLSSPAQGIEVVRPFERTVGDEIQAVFADPAQVIRALAILVREEKWSVGVGIGDVDTPLPSSTRAGSGPAFVAARKAVEGAKKQRPSALVVHGEQSKEKIAGEVCALLRLVVVLWQRRTAQGWEAVEAMEGAPANTQAQVAEVLGISKQALSQRLQSASWQPVHEVLPLLERLLDEANGEVVQDA